MPSGAGGIVAPGDVDGDGDLDLVFGRGALSQNQLYLNDGIFVDNDLKASIALEVIQVESGDQLLPGV